ncbi:MBL fold metallo-hydrolase [Chloroflexota bacterium]
MQKVTDNVYVETGFQGCNVGFVVTKEGVVMIDTPQIPKDAIKWRDEIAKHGKLRYLINTEPHGDHITGDYFFEGTLVAHEGVREAALASSVEQLKERTKQMAPDSLPLLEGYSYRTPDITLSERLTLYLGDHTFELINMPGHTPYQVVVFVPEERVVFTSDNIFHRVMPFLHQALPYEWLDSLKRLRELEVDVMMPGHGELCDRSYIPEMSATIQAWIDAVKEAINKGMSLEEAQEKVAFPGGYSAENEPRMPEVKKMNMTRLYEVLKK